MLNKPSPFAAFSQFCYGHNFRKSWPIHLEPICTFPLGIHRPSPRMMSLYPNLQLKAWPLSRSSTFLSTPLSDSIARVMNQTNESKLAFDTPSQAAPPQLEPLLSPQILNGTHACSTNVTHQHLFTWTLANDTIFRQRASPPKIGSNIDDSVMQMRHRREFSIVMITPKTPGQLVLEWIQPSRSEIRRCEASIIFENSFCHRIN